MRLRTQVTRLNSLWNTGKAVRACEALKRSAALNPSICAAQTRDKVQCLLRRLLRPACLMFARKSSTHAHETPECYEAVSVWRYPRYIEPGHWSGAIPDLSEILRQFRPPFPQRLSDYAQVRGSQGATCTILIEWHSVSNEGASVTNDCGVK